MPIIRSVSAGPPPPPVIRSGGPVDHDFIRRLSIDVFSYLGDYGRIIPEWLAHEGVQSFIAEAEGGAIGFTMLGFYRITAGGARAGGRARDPTDAYAADLLAIAVLPGAQHRGIGRRLLEHAIATARATRKRLPVRELRLSVAEPNLRARTLFAAAGFRDLPGEHGRYDGGQRALHMSLPL